MESNLAGTVYRVYDRPGLNLSRGEKAALTSDLHALGASCFDRLPNYQVFSTSSDALDDKMIVTAYAPSAGGTNPQLVGFASAVHLPPIPGLDEAVFHAGLALVSPPARRTGIPRQLFRQLASHIVKSSRGRVWLTSLAAIPSSLVRMGNFLQDVFPAPGQSLPSETHLRIAREVDKSHRDKMFIAPTAVLEEQAFVFRGGNVGEQRECFRKELDDVRYWHRDEVANSFYRRLMRAGEGDAVLQVGWISFEDLVRRGRLYSSGQAREESSKSDGPRLMNLKL